MTVRILIVSDIHSNLEALRAVLDQAHQGAFHLVWCLGDVVGYGPDPGPCIDLLREHESLCVAGNHDYGAVGKADIDLFNPYGAAACQWTGEQLTPEHRRYLEELPQVLQQSSFTLVHGSLRDPTWEYLLSYEAAVATFGRCTTPHCLVGHSHIPFSFQEGAGFQQFRGHLRVALGSERLIINPGSVGQPRDADPRASYAVYDTETQQVEHYRVEYDIAAVQEKMRRADLPRPLIERLSQGW